MKSIELNKKANIIGYLLIFVVLIGFSFSTVDKTSVNLNNKIHIDKLIIEDLNFLKNKYILSEVISILENQKLESFINFEETLTFNLIKEICMKVIGSKYKNIPMEEINEILNIIIIKISEISKLDINKEFFINLFIIL